MFRRQRKFPQRTGSRLGGSGGFFCSTVSPSIGISPRDNTSMSRVNQAPNQLCFHVFMLPPNARPTADRLLPI
jgi:hypothetical protein